MNKKIIIHSESDNHSNSNRLSLNELKSVMEKIHKLGIRHIQFSGGEPLCRLDDMIELMEYSGGSTDYWVSTSGFGLTPEAAVKTFCLMPGSLKYFRISCLPAIMIRLMPGILSFYTGDIISGKQVVTGPGTGICL